MNSLSTYMRDGAPEWLQDTYQAVSSPEGLTAAVGIATALLTGYITNHIQNKQANIFPVVPSQISEVKEPNEATRFYAAVNDATMIIAEAWNEARAAKNYKKFSDKLDISNLNRQLTQIRRNGKELTNKLTTHKELKTDAAGVGSGLDDSWSYRRQDHTKMVQETYMGTDHKGKPKLKTRWVSKYDYSVHFYTFDVAKANKSLSDLDAMLEQYRPEKLYNPNIVDEPIQPNSESNDAVLNTVFEDPEYELKDGEVSEIINNWNSSPILSDNLNSVNAHLHKLASDLPSLREAIENSEESYYYKTYSRSNSGPEGYQNANELKQDAYSIRNSVAAVLKNIETLQTAGEEIAELQVIDPYKKKKAKDVAFEYLDMAVEMFDDAFPDSKIDMDQRVSHGATTGIALGAGVVAAAVTYFIMNS